MQLSPHLFWDSNVAKMDTTLHARAIIEKVITRGTLSDWREILRHYGAEGIASEVVKIRSLDPVTLNFCSGFFNIPKTEFRCFNTTPSIQALWIH
jgi:hypothetical protein